MFFRILLFAIPAFLIFLFIKEYLKQKNTAAENWDTQWEEKKKDVQQEQELKEKEREIERLKHKINRLKDDKTNDNR